MPERYFVPLLFNFEFLNFKKQMLQAANTVLLNPLVPKAQNSECQNILFSLQIEPIKLS